MKTFIRAAVFLAIAAIGVAQIPNAPAQFIIQGSRGGPPVPTGGGGDLPSWVPDPGTMEQIALNSAADPDVDSKYDALNPDAPGNSPWHGTSGILGPFDSWVGGAYASDYGTNGALLAFGGGHLAYYGNEVYAFDLDTQLWTRLNDPTYPFSFNTTEGELAAGAPASSHTYGHTEYVSDADGGGSQGAFIRAIGSSNHTEGTSGSGGVTFRSHWLDVATGVWSRLSDDYAESGDDSTAVAVAVDTSRNRLWMIGRGAPPQYLPLDAGSGSRNWTSVGSDYYIATGAVAEYLPTRDWVVVLDLRDSDQLHVMDAANPGAGLDNYASDVVGTWPNGEGAPISWSPTLGKFISIDAAGDTLTLRYLEPPASLGGTWTWTSETFTGVAPAGTVVEGLYNRGRWVEACLCFITWPLYNQVNAYRPAATAP
jgi:hypothetical protein